LSNFIDVTLQCNLPIMRLCHSPFASYEEWCNSENIYLSMYSSFQLSKISVDRTGKYLKAFFASILSRLYLEVIWIQILC